MKHRNIVGSQVRKLRYQRGWSQERLIAKLQLQGLDISRQSLGRIENGQQAVFDFEILAFCHVFHVDERSLHPSFDPFAPDFQRKFLDFVDARKPQTRTDAGSEAQMVFAELCSRGGQ